MLIPQIPHDHGTVLSQRLDCSPGGSELFRYVHDLEEDAVNFIMNLAVHRYNFKKRVEMYLVKLLLSSTCAQNA